MCEIRQPAAICRYPLDFVQSSGRHPAQRLVVMRVGLTANQAHTICAQRSRVIQRNVGAEALTHRDIADLEAQFLGQLAGQRVALGFTGRDLAAREFPTTGQLRRPCPLRHQDRGTRDDRPGNDDLGRHGQ